MDLAHGGDNFQQRGALRPPAVVLIPGLLMAFYVWLNLLTTIPYPGKIFLRGQSARAERGPTRRVFC